MSSRKKIAVSIAAFVLIGVVTIVAAYEAEIRPIRAKVLAGGRIARNGRRKDPASDRRRRHAASLHPRCWRRLRSGSRRSLRLWWVTASKRLPPRDSVICGHPYPVTLRPQRRRMPMPHCSMCSALTAPLSWACPAGAPSAMQLALRHPERVAALILLVPRGYAPGYTVKLDSTPGNQAVLKVILAGADFAYWLMLHVTPSVLTRFVGVPPEVLDKAGPDDQRWATRVLTSILPLSMRVAGVKNDSSIRVDAWPLERIAAPTLIVTTSDDLFHTQPAAEYAAAHIPGAKLVRLPDRRPSLHRPLGGSMCEAPLPHSSSRSSPMALRPTGPPQPSTRRSGSRNKSS